MIALVDDDEIFQFTASRIIALSKVTERLCQFKNGAEAIRYIEKHANTPEELPDIIFLDINMPVSDGWMFLEDIARIEGQLAKKSMIYMLSSSIDPRDVERVKNNKLVTDYLVKPLSRETFIEIISGYTDGQHLS